MEKSGSHNFRPAWCESLGSSKPQLGLAGAQEEDYKYFSGRSGARALHTLTIKILYSTNENGNYGGMAGLARCTLPQLQLQLDNGMLQALVGGWSM